MKLTRAILTSAALSSAALLSLPAAATGPDPAALFDRGVADMEAGHFGTACPFIEASYKIDPLPGTLFALAECEAKRGRTATALARYDDYLALHGALSPERRARQGDREKVARAQKATLGAVVPELTLVLPPNAPQGVTVTRDGVVVDRPELGIPIRVDPGDHVIVTRAPGRPASTVSISLAARERRGIALVIADPEVPVVVPPPPADWRLPTGITAIGVGAAFLATGIISGIEVTGVNNEPTLMSYRVMLGPGASNVCADAAPGGAFPNAGVASLCAKGTTFQTLQFVSYPLAAVFAGVGSYLVVTHTRPSKPAATNLVVVPTVGPRFAGMGASLRF
jgi:hypothetical protein